MAAAVEVRDLSKVYSSNSGEVRALDGIELTVKAGEFISLVGPSGCGKTTLLHILGDLSEPTSGTITVDGLSAREAREAQMFSYVFQNPVLLPWRNILKNLELPSEILGRKTRDPVELLKMFGLAGTERQLPRQLSGGMRQRAALARALTFDPRVLLMDEPFGAVDELTRNGLNADLLRIWAHIDVTVFLVTHSLSEALMLSDRVFVLSARPGRIKHVLNVPFPRPREETLIETPEFRDLIKNLREELE